MQRKGQSKNKEERIKSMRQQYEQGKKEKKIRLEMRRKVCEGEEN